MAEINEILANAREQLNLLVGNMFQITEDDMAMYDACYADVFKDGVNFSFMSATFFAQFAPELLLAALSSNPFRKFVVQAIEAEKTRSDPGEYWDENMDVLRFGRPDRDYSTDNADILSMMNTSYVKLTALNNWYGKDAGREEFEMYCLSGRAVKDIKAMICQMPYLIRHFDYDKQFAAEIMEYAGIVANQIRDVANGN